MTFYQIRPIGFADSPVVEVNVQYIKTIIIPEGDRVKVIMAGMKDKEGWWILREEYDAGIAKQIAFISGRKVDG